MTKRNRRNVVDARWAKKETQGRVVKDEEHSYNKPPIQAKNKFQIDLIKSIKSSKITIVDAPAGVGKSFVVMSEVSDAVKKGAYNKIFMTRPAVGMGPTIGLLKGGMREKFEPYLLPLVDVLCSRYGRGFYESSLENGVIEFCPLEYIRGRNLASVAIVDECQNVTPKDMYTLITRVAEGGKLILIGDSTQNDLRGKTGLQWLAGFVERHNLQEYFECITATSDDIVRSEICYHAVKARETDLKNNVDF